MRSISMGSRFIFWLSTLLIASWTFFVLYAWFAFGLGQTIEASTMRAPVRKADLPPKKITSVLQQPLRDALRQDDISKVERLLKQGADVNGMRGANRPPLHFAQSKAMTALLLAHGAKVNQRDSYYETALMFAAEHGRTEQARMLLDDGADVNAYNVFGETALFNAADGGNAAVTRLLLQRGADIYARNGKGETALDTAKSTPDRQEIVRILEAEEQAQRP